MCFEGIRIESDGALQLGFRFLETFGKGEGNAAASMCFGQSVIQLKGFPGGGHDVLIVDRMLPGIDGLEIIAALRREQVRTPVLVLSALGGVDDRVRGLRAGPLELDLIERSARRGARAIDLLPREFQLLEFMMRREGQVVTRAMLLEEVWNYRFVPQTNLVDVHMGRLRRKIDAPDEAPLIHSVRGAGFTLRAPA